jgi:hypothetical protein
MGQFKPVHFVGQRQGNVSFVDSCNPWMFQRVYRCVPLCDVEAGKLHEQVPCKARKVGGAR